MQGATSEIVEKNLTIIAGKADIAQHFQMRLEQAEVGQVVRIAAERQLDAALRLGAPVVEFHTGEYANACAAGARDKVEREMRRITEMAALAAKNGIEPHAGHGLTFENVQPIAAIPQIAELNIGHYLIGEAVFVGLENAIRRMRELMDEVR